MVLAEIFSGMSETLGAALAQTLPEGPISSFLVANAFLMLTIVAALVTVLFLLVAFFFDFVADAWKIPLGAAIDVLKYLSLANPLFGYAAAILGALLFIFVSDAKFMRWVFAAGSVALAVASLAYSDRVIGVLLAVAPINTMMIFAATIID